MEIDITHNHFIYSHRGHRVHREDQKREKLNMLNETLSYF